MSEGGTSTLFSKFKFLDLNFQFFFIKQLFLQITLAFKEKNYGSNHQISATIAHLRVNLLFKLIRRPLFLHLFKNNKYNLNNSCCSRSVFRIEHFKANSWWLPS